MAPIKFEDQLRDKLEERNLQPTTQSWSQLQERLDDHESKNRSYRVWWIGIAASIIGVILVVTQFYKSTEVVENSPVIVNSEVESQVEIEPNEVRSSPEILLTTNEESQDIQDKESSFILEKPAIRDLQKERIVQDEVVQKESIDKLVASSSEEENKSQLPEDIVIKDINLDKSIVESVVAEVKAEQNSEVPVSNRQIDSLLKEAQKDLLQQKLLDDNRQTVSADALLEDIEMELEETFRDKLFDAIKTNFNSVKTAVANRNN